MVHPDLCREFTKAHNNSADLRLLEKFVESRVELQIFKLAVIEYHHALYSVSIAHYRQGYFSLRLFLELSLCCVLFSAHEIDSHIWLKGKKDTNWQSIISNENGVFSKNFIKAFFDEMGEYAEQYHVLAAKVYRECSEFVHGNPTSFIGIEGEIAFSEELLRIWLERAQTVQRVVKFAFLCRFLKVTPTNKRGSFEDLLLTDFSEMAPLIAALQEN
jgi:hypothetical protein